MPCYVFWNRSWLKRNVWIRSKRRDGARWGNSLKRMSRKDCSETETKEGESRERKIFHLRMLEIQIMMKQKPPCRVPGAISITEYCSSTCKQLGVARPCLHPSREPSRSWEEGGGERWGVEREMGVGRVHGVEERAHSLLNLQVHYKFGGLGFGEVTPWKIYIVFSLDTYNLSKYYHYQYLSLVNSDPQRNDHETHLEKMFIINVFKLNKKLTSPRTW